MESPASVIVGRAVRPPQVAPESMAAAFARVPDPRRARTTCCWSRRTSPPGTPWVSPTSACSSDPPATLGPAALADRRETAATDGRRRCAT